MKIDSATIKSLATLARLRVNPEEEVMYAEGLSNILTWIDQLQQVDTKSVDPLTGGHVQQAPVRADVVTDGGYVEQILQNAPDKALDMFFCVPKVVE
jgi:aspartyl-tRNA(Asn)/glutamyl-tRNA(Gln) amidotransferase subunit C